MSHKRNSLLFKFVKIMGWYPPYWGTGISVKEVNKKRTSYIIQMKLRFYNLNAYGSHFGGSLYSMCDPWYAFIANAYFGDNYVIWDKSASIAYKKPGKGRVTAKFEISDIKLQSMKDEVDSSGKSTFTFHTHILDEKGNIVSDITKEIYIKKR